MRRPEPAAKGLVERDGRYLLLKHEFDDGSVWGLPGGHVEFGEHPRETVRREVREETTLDVTVDDALGAYTFTFAAGTRQVVATVYACDDPGGNVDVGENPADEPITGYAWARSEELAALAMDDELRTLLERAELF